MSSSYISEWRQCYYASIEDVPNLKEIIQENHVDENGLYIFLTHSCSISQEDFKKEPLVEYILARPIKECNPAFCGRNNPRILHINVKEQFYEIIVHERGFIDRRVLSSIKPLNCALPSDVADMLIRWITSRYNAPALPDNFNNRLNPIKSKIAKKLKSSQITGVYVILDPEHVELNDDDNYQMEVVITVYRDTTNEDFIKCEQIAGEIEKLLLGVSGIELVGEKVSVHREQKITIADLREMRLMQFDYLSERKKPGGKVPVQA